MARARPREQTRPAAQASLPFRARPLCRHSLPRPRVRPLLPCPTPTTTGRPTSWAQGDIRRSARGSNGAPTGHLREESNRGGGRMRQGRVPPRPASALALMPTTQTGRRSVATAADTPTGQSSLRGWRSEEALRQSPYRIPRGQRRPTRRVSSKRHRRGRAAQMWPPITHIPNTTSSTFLPQADNRPAKPARTMSYTQAPTRTSLRSRFPHPWASIA